jgi:phosphomannomutase
MATLVLFDVDGTLVESGQSLKPQMVEALIRLSQICDIGIVGGGTYQKIKSQLGDTLSLFKYIFAESGSCYYKHGDLIHQNEMRNHPTYASINKLKKVALRYLSNVDYDLTGTLLDQRSGLLYISLIGMQANMMERENFIKLDLLNNYRLNLLSELREANDNPSIQISLGGAVGISIHPKEWDKTQVLDHVQNDYQTIYYFGDKYLPNGNDYCLLSNSRIKGRPVDNVDMTLEGIDYIISVAFQLINQSGIGIV